MLARIPESRATKDLDLVSTSHDLDDAQEALEDLASIDLGDHVQFVLVDAKNTGGGANQPEAEHHAAEYARYLAENPSEQTPEPTNKAESMTEKILVDSISKFLSPHAVFGITVGQYVILLSMLPVWIITYQMPAAVQLYLVSHYFVGWLQSRWVTYKYPVPMRMLPCRRPIYVEGNRQWYDYETPEDANQSGERRVGSWRTTVAPKKPSGKAFDTR